MASKELKRVLEIVRSMPVNEDASLQEMRAEMEKTAFLQPEIQGVSFAPQAIGGVRGAWITPEAAEKNAAVLYFHGGGYCMGSINTHREMASRIAAASKTRVFIIAYRLAPEDPFPAALKDAETVYRGMLKNGRSPEKMVVAGDSAGGGLAVALLLRLKACKLPLPAAAVCISPWLDLTLSGDSMKKKRHLDHVVRHELISKMARAYLNGEDPSNPLASPLFGNLENLPPMLIQVGTAEVLMDDSVRLAHKATAAGVDVTLETWEDMVHVWHTFAEILPEAGEAIDAIGSYVLHHAR
ncbi:MAG: alpha/beta hydrolase [Desulfobacterales bacterium]